MEIEKNEEDYLSNLLMYLLANEFCKSSAHQYVYILLICCIYLVTEIAA